MSWKASGYVKGLTDNLMMSEKFVLQILADYHNEAKGYAWPSLDLLAKQCLITRQGLVKVLNRLEEKDFIRRERGGGSGKTTVYQIVGIDVENCKPGFTVLESENCKQKRPETVNAETKNCKPEAIAIKEEPIVTEPIGEPLVLAPPSSAAKPSPQVAVTTQDKAKRHTTFKDKIFSFYRWKWGRDCPWDGSEAKQLSNLLASDPKLTVEEFSRWLYNYSESKDITPGERPRAFLPRIHSYSVTKLNQFRQDADVRTETFDSTRVRNTDDAFAEAARNLASASSNGSDTASRDDSAGSPDVGNVPRTILSR